VIYKGCVSAFGGLVFLSSLYALSQVTLEEFYIIYITMLFPAFSSSLVGLAILQNVVGSPSPNRGGDFAARSESDVISVAKGWKKENDIVPSIYSSSGSSLLAGRIANTDGVERRFFGVVRPFSPLTAIPQKGRSADSCINILDH
jgi:hypothetical protein